MAVKIMKEEDLKKAVEELTEALRFTVDYVGLSTLPPIRGWSWYDALVKYAPNVAKNFKQIHERNKDLHWVGDDTKAMNQIAHILSGEEWDADTMSEVAEIIQASGREIKEFE